MEEQVVYPELNSMQEGMEMRKRLISMFFVFVLILSCSGFAAAESALSPDRRNDAEDAEKAESAVRFDLTLDSYVPKKDHYNFFFTYKTVHAWWDAVAMGMEDAQKQFLNRGIVVTYEYLAPEVTSAEDQKNQIEIGRASCRERV